MGLFEFSVDIETAAGVKVGSGPITSATNWTHKPRLDGAGEFSFSMPASDEKSRNLANKRIARCYAIMDGVRTELGAGIIDTIQTSVGEPTMLEVSGPDIMGELATRTVGNLIIREQAWTYLNDADNGTVHWIERRYPEDWTYDGDYGGVLNDADTDTSDTVTITSAKSGYPEHAVWLYIGHDARFDQIRFTFATPSTAADADDALSCQYFASTGDWTALTVTDNTRVVGPWEQNGTVTFTRPADWERYNEAVGGAGDWFWVRMRAQTNAPDDPRSIVATIAEVEVYADTPTKHGVNLIMSFAPATWTGSGWVITDADVYPLTITDKYIQFQGESVLEALLTLSEQGGKDGTTAIREHFRYDTTTARKVDWIGTTVTSSGVRAVAPEYALLSEGKAEIAIIQSLTERQDTAEMITRIYPRSGDNQTIALTTLTAPTGYTQDLTNGYIQHTAGYNTYGQIDAWVEFSELSMQQADSYTNHPEMLANQLQERTVEYLRERAGINYFYNLSIAQFMELIRPGDTIDCVYHEYVDTYHTVDIDTIKDGTPLNVLASTLQANSQGVGIIGLEVATIDREAKTDAGVVVDLVRQQKRYGSNAGNYATIAVTGTGQPPSAGADIRVSGYQVSRAGNGVLLFSGSGALLAEYAADATGLTAALAAAASGDAVGLPAGTIAGDHTIPAGVTVMGMGGASILSGTITNNGALVNVKANGQVYVYQSGVPNTVSMRAGTGAVGGSSVAVLGGEGTTGEGGRAQLEGGYGGADGGIAEVYGGSGGTGAGGNVHIGAGDGGASNGVVKLFDPTTGLAAVLDMSDLTAADKTFTFPNASGTVALTSNLHPALTLGANPGLSLSTQELVLGTPSTLTVSTTNAVSGTGHTHAITASAAPGATESILASTAAGFLTLVGATAIGVGTGIENTVFGVGAGQVNTTGTKNVFVGYLSGEANTEGYQNAGLGWGALKANTTGHDNMAVGSSALLSNTTGFGNLAIGKSALLSNVGGYQNVAIGAESQLLGVSGVYNVSIGAATMSGGIVAGSANIAIGYGAILALTGGSNNTAIGHQALAAVTTANFNTAVGYLALTKATGSSNTGVGHGALVALTSGGTNTAVGHGSLANLVTGGGNVALGYYAGAYELGSNAFYVNNQDRSDTAGDKAKSLLFGAFNATAASQVLTVNASLGVFEQTPQARLHVTAAIGANPFRALILQNDDDTLQTESTVYMDFVGGNTAAPFARILAGGEAAWSGAQGYLSLLTRDGASTLQEALRITSAQRVGIAVSPTARLHLPAGSATASTAPLKLTSGTLLTTAEAGAVEFLTDDFFATITTGAARKAFVLDDGARLTATRVPFATTNGRLTDDADLTFATDTLSATKVAASGGVTTQAVDFTASTPDALAGDVNNWDLGNNTFIRASGGAADRIVTGIVARASGHLLIFQNIGTTNKITFANESASSTAANRLINANAGSTEITPNHCIVYIYDATTARWREITHL